MDVGRCRYSMICNKKGGIHDDVIAYRFDDHWMLVVNASNREKILSHLDAQVGDLKVNIQDRTMETAMVAIQGPKVIENLGRFADEVPQLKRYAFCILPLMGMELIVSRTGYTGEDGVEVIMSAAATPMVLDLLESEMAGDGKVSIRPAGLGELLGPEARLPRRQALTGSPAGF